MEATKRRRLMLVVLIWLRNTVARFKRAVLQTSIVKVIEKAMCA
jgi:hypothetical protein